jgi:hypothetical protein
MPFFPQGVFTGDIEYDESWNLHCRRACKSLGTRRAASIWFPSVARAKCMCMYTDKSRVGVDESGMEWNGMIVKKMSGA